MQAEATAWSALGEGGAVLGWPGVPQDPATGLAERSVGRSGAASPAPDVPAHVWRFSVRIKVLLHQTPLWETQSLSSLGREWGLQAWVSEGSSFPCSLCPRGCISTASPSVTFLTLLAPPEDFPWGGGTLNFVSVWHLVYTPPARHSRYSHPFPKST